MKHIALLIIGLFILSSCTGNKKGTYDHDYRPQIHFSPEKNWMNDPNGMFYDDGLYHLYYQYNPFGETWGHMSWGHATSEDLVHWEHHPVALEEEDGIMIFSGSAVVDRDNTSGFGTEENYPIVAIYTGHQQGLQTQDIAYSLDGGYEWTKYENNPVLDIGMADFRDPKVMWHEDTQKWIMVVALSADQILHFYSSDNLIDWEFLSEFGPEGATGGLWECPDLFELPVDGDESDTKWVLQVDLGSNSNNKGSGGQYFVGEFDGTTFTPDTLLPGTPQFVPNGKIFEDFENGLGEWTPEGEAFETNPVKGGIGDQNPVTGFDGQFVVNSFFGGDESTGTLTSGEFSIESEYINLLVGGGSHPETAVQLIVDGEVVRKASGTNSETLKWENWNVSAYEGKTAIIKIVDEHTGGWGHILVDQIQFSDIPARNAKEGARWIDHGADFYAAVTWFNWDESMGEQWLAWSNNWIYAEKIPTEGWRGSMSLARDISLKNVNGEVKLFQWPVMTYADQRVEKSLVEVEFQSVDPNWELPVKDILNHGTFELEMSLEAGTSEDFGVIFSDNQGGELSLRVDGESNQFTVQRRESDPGFESPVFSDPQIIDNFDASKPIEMMIIYDRSIAEIYLNQGEYTFVNRVFMNNESLKAEAFSDDGTANITHLKAWKLSSAW